MKDWAPWIVRGMEFVMNFVGGLEFVVLGKASKLCFVLQCCLAVRRWRFRIETAEVGKHARVVSHKKMAIPVWSE